VYCLKSLKNDGLLIPQDALMSRYVCVVLLCIQALRRIGARSVERFLSLEARSSSASHKHLLLVNIPSHEFGQHSVENLF
jgi:hypothetical protein